MPVDRSSEGASDAFRMQARAFTTNRGVVIPPTVGSLESGPGEALLTHELTHVAQRARYGATLPDESSPAGQVLEAEARSAQLVLDSGASVRPIPEPARGAPSWSGALGGQENRVDPGAALPLAAPAPAGPNVDALAESILDRLSSPAGPGGGQGHTMEFTPASWMAGAGSMAPPAAPAAPMAATGVQRDPVDNPPPAAGPSVTPAPSGEPAPGSMPRPSEQDLTNLSGWLYPLIKYRLKGELREDRERAGLVTDHYRRW